MIRTNLTPLPVGQQAPPTRAAAAPVWRALRDARKAPPVDYRDGLPSRLTKGSDPDITKASRGDGHAVQTDGLQTARNEPHRLPAINRIECPKSPECAALHYSEKPRPESMKSMAYHLPPPIHC